MTFTHRRLLCAVSAAAILAGAGAANAEVRQYDIPSQALGDALARFGAQSDVSVVTTSEITRTKTSQALSGEAEPEVALAQLLTGTGLGYRREGDTFLIVRADAPQSGSAAGDGAGTVEALIVTAQKREEDIQDVPIAISAFTQESLTERQIAGGPDLITQIPNFTFTKTNFASYSIQIRGIGTQAISVTTDPAVAVAFNGIPFIRNHFFEQEFYDVASVEVLRGPQGTLFGRNATAGVVNLRSAPPTYHYAAKVSGDLGSYDNRRLEGMVNIPLIEDKLALRVAGEWTKRDGYSHNEALHHPTDGRDLWSTRASLRYEPTSWLRANLVWEHFNEDDDRIRSGKQLCKKDPGPATVAGLVLADIPTDPFNGPPDFDAAFNSATLTQGCLPVSLYSDEAFQTPNGEAIPFIPAGQFLFGDGSGGYMLNRIDPYASRTQSRDLRVFESAVDPTYKARNDTYEFNIDIDLGESLTVSSQTGYSRDQIRSTQDFNRFNTAPGLFSKGFDRPPSAYAEGSPLEPGGVYCDPQVGCSTAMVGVDLSRAWGKQFSQELRLSSDFEGPLNFSIGANFLRYKTLEDYFVFFNLITAMEQIMNGSAAGHYDYCQPFSGEPVPIQPVPYTFDFLGFQYEQPSNFSCTQGSGVGTYIDPNPIDSLDGLGHNYFRSKNPYRLTSKAIFGEAYYQVTPELKLTAGLRWTNDRKRSVVVPSQTFLVGGGYPESGVVDQEWKEMTGRFVADWSPDLSFTDNTMAYASYARGYKAGGANPPGTAPCSLCFQALATHPPTFEPEFVDAFELGTKNTLLDGKLTLNGTAFYYDYKGYQISQIVDRTSINLNFDAKVKGLELEGAWQPSEALRFNFAVGLQDSSVGKGQSAIDLIDRTAGHEGWVVVKPFLTDTSNCILPEEVVRAIIETYPHPQLIWGMAVACGSIYPQGSVLGSILPFDRILAEGVGFDPATAPNGGAGFAKDLGGNKLPNAPEFTLSLGAQYSMPLRNDWIATVRADGYWAGNSYARIFNDEPYDKLRHRTNLNLAVILTGGADWTVMGYVKNVLNDDQITGAFLNSDDTALTTNIFLNEPRLFGVRISKGW